MPCTTLKITAYITRERGGRAELLVFDHPEQDYFVSDGPKPWLQVPAGTGEPGEDALATVLREVEEESGLSGFAAVRFLGAFDDQPWGIRHVFHMPAPAGVPERFVHRVKSESMNCIMLFRYEWVSLEYAAQHLGIHAQWLPLVEADIESLRQEASAQGG
jgi:8-oxo-dGTP pyrophosphatase MutT (NUDIX family)